MGAGSESGRALGALTGHQGAVYRAEFSPDGKRGVTACPDPTGRGVQADLTARVWDAESGRALATLTGHQGAVITAAWSPDGKRVVTARWTRPREFIS